jgi:hypothetical protein
MTKRAKISLVPIAVVVLAVDYVLSWVFRYRQSGTVILVLFLATFVVAFPAVLLRKRWLSEFENEQNSSRIAADLGIDEAYVSMSSLGMISQELIDKLKKDEAFNELQREYREATQIPEKKLLAQRIVARALSFMP